MGLNTNDAICIWYYVHSINFVVVHDIIIMFLPYETVL